MRCEKQFGVALWLRLSDILLLLRTRILRCMISTTNGLDSRTGRRELRQFSKRRAAHAERFRGPSHRGTSLIVKASCSSDRFPWRAKKRCFSPDMMVTYFLWSAGPNLDSLCWKKTLILPMTVRQIRRWYYTIQLVTMSYFLNKARKSVSASTRMLSRERQR